MYVGCQNGENLLSEVAWLCFGGRKLFFHGSPSTIILKHRLLWLCRIWEIAHFGNVRQYVNDDVTNLSGVSRNAFSYQNKSLCDENDDRPMAAKKTKTLCKLSNLRLQIITTLFYYVIFSKAFINSFVNSTTSSRSWMIRQKTNWEAQLFCAPPSRPSKIVQNKIPERLLFPWRIQLLVWISLSTFKNATALISHPYKYSGNKLLANYSVWLGHNKPLTFSAAILHKVFLVDVQMIPLKATPHAVWALSRVQSPRRWKMLGIVPHRSKKKSEKHSHHSCSWTKLLFYSVKLKSLTWSWKWCKISFNFQQISNDV